MINYFSKINAYRAIRATEGCARSKVPTARDYQQYVGDSFKAFNDKFKELEKKIKTLEIRVFPCKECSMSSCDGCPHKEANH